MPINNKCILCDRDCTTEDLLTSDATKYQCTSCGHFYIIFPTDQTLLDMTPEDKQRIAACTRERTIWGLPDLWLFSDEPTEGAPEGAYAIEHVLGTLFPSRIQDRFDRALRNLCRMTKVPGQAVPLSIKDDLPVIFAEHQATVNFMLQELQNLKYISLPDPRTGISGPIRAVTVTASGIARMQQLEDAEGRELSTQAFVAMWFDKQLNDIYTNGIARAINDCGLKDFRVDAKETNKKICDEIIAEIRRSKLLIADFTGSRGGVYFEAGFAMGLGIPVIWTCRNLKDDIDKLHFDTRQYCHVLWDGADDLRQKLRNRIMATIPGLKSTW